jgi:hypothetical protein
MMKRGPDLRMPQGWVLASAPDVFAGTVREFMVPAVRAVPPCIGRRLMPCRIELVPRLAGLNVTSRWRRSPDGLEIAMATTGIEPHDAALELLTCIGQALWDEARPEEAEGFLELLRRELVAGVSGEIDEAPLEQKRRLVASRESARSPERLRRYARASFAATVAEYVHALWHDVTVRTGSEYLPAESLRRRLEWIAERFPPGRGRKLFPDR